MEWVRSGASIKGPAQWFTGEAHLDPLIPSDHPSRGRCNLGHFTPGARTAWHRHANGQLLHVTSGLGLTQSRGEAAVLMHPGDAIWCPPGEWHWHGATSARHMSHLAFWDTVEASQDQLETEWGQHVSDEEYLGAQPSLVAAATHRPATRRRD